MKGNHRMTYLWMGSLAFLFFVIYDINSVILNSRLLHSAFFIGCFLLVAATGGLISVTLAQEPRVTDRVFVFIPLAVVFLFLLVYTLFFAVPFEDTYMKSDGSPEICTTGFYALSRHPGFLWFAGLYFSLWLALSGDLLLSAGILFCLLNLLYIIFQDRWTFMKIFPDYGDYKKMTPFLIPNRQSFSRCIRTFR